MEALVHTSLAWVALTTTLPRFGAFSTSTRIRCARTVDLRRDSMGGLMAPKNVTVECASVNLRLRCHPVSEPLVPSSEQLGTHCACEALRGIVDTLVPPQMLQTSVGWSADNRFSVIEDILEGAVAARTGQRL